MSGCKEKRDLASESTSDESDRTICGNLSQQLRDAVGNITGIHRWGWALGFAETDQIGRNDLVAHGEVAVNLGPLVRRGSKEIAVKEKERLTGTADVVNDLALGSLCHACGKNRGRDGVWYRLSTRTPRAATHGKSYSPQQTNTNTQTEYGVFLPVWEHVWRNESILGAL